jgi:hypothetical protein
MTWNSKYKITFDLFNSFFCFTYFLYINEQGLNQLDIIFSDLQEKNNP